MMADFAGGADLIHEPMSPEEASRHLQIFTATRSEESFRRLTEGHAALVYSTALRVVNGDAGLAEDVVQLVFSALAVKPQAVRDGRALAAWLHRAAVRRATDVVRTETRRRKREHLSMHMSEPAHSQTEAADLWDQASAMIDDAMDRLPEAEREFLVLRFWQRHDLGTIGSAFGMTDNAVQKRISRALDKLRSILSRRGVRGTSAALSSAMLGAAFTAPSSAAIAALTTTALALAKTASTTTATSFLAHTLAMTAKHKIAVTTAAALVAVGAPAYILQYQQVQRLKAEVDALRTEARPSAPAAAVQRLEAEVTRLRNENRLAASPTGLAESRAEVARLTEKVRKQQAELATRESALNTLRSARTGAAGGGSGAPPVVLEGGLHAYGSGNGDLPTANGKVQWDHGQATGAPDTAAAGDRPTAWAPLSPKSGEQWLQLGYNKAVELKEINIHETHNPGAVSKVAAIMPDGSEKMLWQGRQSPGGDEIIESSVPIPPGTTARQIKVYVDTNRVESWPEIDAVELVGTDGSKQWATESSASSSYSEKYGSSATMMTRALRGTIANEGGPASGGMAECR